MRNKSETEAFTKAIETYGEANQLVILFEEMSELQKEVCKSIRYNKRQFRNPIAEEVADVEIMLEQVKMIYGIEEEVEMWRLDKVVRLRENLGLAPSRSADFEEWNRDGKDV